MRHKFRSIWALKQETCWRVHGLTVLARAVFEIRVVDFQARKRHINIIFFVRLVLGRPRVCPGDFTGFVPGTDPVKTWDKPGFSPYLTQWKPDFTGFVPGTIPGTKGGTESLCEKSLCAFFARWIWRGPICGLCQWETFAE